MIQQLPIGVFDSGVGGLTVLKALTEALPKENFLYLGDTARLPYGTKSQQTVTDYALACGRFLADKKIKLLVVACNTASSVALQALSEALAPIPVIGVVEPGALAGINASSSKHIAVLATESTVKWHAYKEAIAKVEPAAEVNEWPCSLLVPLAEEGWLEGDLVESIIARILQPMLSDEHQPDTVVLGCTHFPALKNAIQSVLGNDINLIDSAHSTSLVVKQYLEDNQMQNPQSSIGQSQYMATDSLSRFKRMADRFMHQPLSDQQLAQVDVHLSLGLTGVASPSECSNTKKG